MYRQTERYFCVLRDDFLYMCERDFLFVCRRGLLRILQRDSATRARNARTEAARTKNTDRIFELLLRVLLILQDPRRDLICMLGYALAPGNPHASEDYASRACAFRWETSAGRREAGRRREARRNSCKHFTLRLAVYCRASVG